MVADLFMETLKPLRRKLKFILGKDPLVLTQSNSERFVPSPYKTVILISADFELAWAPRYKNSVQNPLEFALEKARIERSNIPRILELCDTYNIPVTWATVGHLFLSKCFSNNGRLHPDIPLVSTYHGFHWDFHGTDWFEHDPGSTLEEAPEWYAPDLIRLIRESNTSHEIGCHTFSHIDCRDGICPPELLRAELHACRKLAGEQGIRLTSFIHPGHTIGNLDTLADEGYTNFRTDYRNVLGFPKRHQNGLWELEQSMELRYYPYWSDKFQVYRYRKIIDRAIRSGTICVFWFHPSFDPLFLKHVMPGMFSYLDEKKQEAWVTTHHEYISWLNAQSHQDISAT